MTKRAAFRGRVAASPHGPRADTTRPATTSHIEHCTFPSPALQLLTTNFMGPTHVGEDAVRRKHDESTTKRKVCLYEIGIVIVGPLMNNFHHYLFIGAVFYGLVGCGNVQSVSIPGLGPGGNNLELQLKPSLRDSLTHTDKSLHYTALARLLDTGQIGDTQSWSNPTSRNSGSFVLTRRFRRSAAAKGAMSNAPCGEFIEVLNVNDATQRTSGMAAAKVYDNAGNPRWVRIQ